MKALRYLGPELLEVQDIQTPSIADDEVLLRVRSCGICGSDVHGWLGLTGRRTPPMTMGHEFSGEIAATGVAVESWSIGDRVTAQPAIFCGNCRFCAEGLTNLCENKRFFGVMDTDGAFAKYLAVPARLLYRLPDSMTFETGALTEPYAVALGAVKKAGDIAGKTVVVIGAGAIGLCVLKLLALAKPALLIACDLSDERLALAIGLGADAAVNPKKAGFNDEISRLTGGMMADITIEAVGVEKSANQSISALKPNGVAVWVGMSQREMTINMQEIVGKAREIRGTYTYTHAEFGEALHLLGEKSFDAERIVTKTIPLCDTAKAFRELNESPDKNIKILVTPE